MPKRISKIYVDMDGVLADFDKKWEEIYGVRISEGPKGQKGKDRFAEFVNNLEFSVLDPMPDMKNLVEYLNDRWSHVPIEILSSTANETYHDSISHQKSIWLQKHNITWKENFVPGKRHKYKFAEPNAVLIDDHPENIKDWNEAGGIGILHKDAMTTIALLKLYI